MSRDNPIFDQRNQRVMYQYNSTGNINFDSVNSKSDLLTQVKAIRLEIERAVIAKVIPRDEASKTKYNLEMAENEITEAKPDRNRVLEYIGEAKKVVQTVSAAAGLAKAIDKCAEKIAELNPFV